MAENRNVISVLLIEDDEEDVLLMERMVRDSVRHDIHLEVATSLSEGLDRLKSGKIDVVLLDLGLPDSQGLDTFRRLYEADPHVPAVIMSGLDDESAALDAVQSGAQDYLIKGKAGGPSINRAIRYAMERQRLQQQLLAAQGREQQARIDKLAALGVLAGGIAHDFNNLLMGIVGNIGLAKADSPLGGGVRDLLVEAEKASLSAITLTRQLLTFAKGGEPVRSVTSIVDLLQTSVSFVLRGSNVKANFFIPECSVFAEIDAGQIERVFQNIVINADQAMPEGGTINIRVATVMADAEPAVGLDRGKYVKLSFEDNGPGIPMGQISRIFDPYFTTKQKGSGLGLATAYSIVKKHCGASTVESVLGQGTTFHVYLPVWDGAPPRKHEEKPAILSQNGRILVMDDEESVRKLTETYLRRLGFEVSLTSDGLEALTVYRAAMAAGRPFSAVIIDLTVPGGMGGQALIRKLLEMDPHVSAIVSSGYFDDPVMSNPAAHGFRGVVPKPYRMEELRAVLASVLPGIQQTD